MTKQNRPAADRDGAIDAKLKSRIDRALDRARAALVWEQAWPRIGLVFGIVGLFVALSWLGLWTVVPDIVRFAAVGVFVLAALAALVMLARIRIPGDDRALARVERHSGHLHRPVTALTDELSGGGTDPASRALWRRHRARAAVMLDRVSAGAPRPRLYRFDPYGLRTVVAVLLVIGFAVAGPERAERLVSAFRSAPTADASYRIDAWIAPPAYTSRVPIFLTHGKPAARETATELSVPQGSTFVARIQGSGDFTVTLKSGDRVTELPRSEAPEGGDADRRSTSKPAEFQAVLTSGGTIVVADAGKPRNSWTFAVEPDALPTIALSEPPDTTVSSALKLAYSASDDYGVVSAEARMDSAEASKDAAEPLVEAPRFALTLPQRGARSVSGQTIKDLTAHPWAGSTVELRLVARDVAGQEGGSEPFKLKLPARPFADPMARAIVELRRMLAIDRNKRSHVIDALDALMIAPEKYIDRASVYLGMRFTYRSLITAADDDALRDVVDLMWTLALSIEDGDVSLAMRELRQAQEALRQALERGASDEEIRKLTEQLRAALDRFFQALAEQARRNPQAMMPMDPNARALSQQDLQRMLQRIEELARSGSRESAQQLLSQMQQMLENLQTGRMPQPNQQSRELAEMLNQLGEMIRRQRELMEQTHRFGQQQQGEQDRRQNGNGERRRQQGQLQQGQNDLARQLQEMMRRMEELGMQPGNQLGEAQQFMGQAGEAIGKGQSGRAVENQGDALNALREGADQMIEQMMAQGRGQGRRFGNNPNEDPLGRPRQTDGPQLGSRHKIPGEIDVQRARRILEELRKRLSDPSRPRLELDYLDRLIPRN